MTEDDLRRIVTEELQTELAPLLARLEGLLNCRAGMIAQKVHALRAAMRLAAIERLDRERPKST